MLSCMTFSSLYGVRSRRPIHRLTRLALSSFAVICSTLISSACGDAGAASAASVAASEPASVSKSGTAKASASAASRPAYDGAAYAPVPGRPRPGFAALSAIGRAMFFDASLSASGKTACASCHDPAHGFAPANALSVQLAGSDGLTAGVRAAPSLRYLQTLQPFSEHHFDNDGDDSIDAGPTGGHTWDGRASSAHDQARLPLLSSMEMGNGSPAAVVARLERSAVAPEFRRAFGDDVFKDADAAFRSALMALEVYQETPAVFYPYTSKYDAVLRGQAKLSPQEARGLALFNDEAKGNCAACHLSAPTPEGAFPLFTDYGHIAIGVPRNAAIPSNVDKGYFDLGLCGPLRTDFQNRPEYCGLFRTPSLRNVALRKSYFHNGAFHSLEDAVRFYAQRDTRPERYYPKDAHGHVRKYDDLPERYVGNVNVEPPFGGKAGGKPSLNEAEIKDVVAFLKTLTDADLLTASNAQNKADGDGHAKSH